MSDKVLSFVSHIEGLLPLAMLVSIMLYYMTDCQVCAVSVSVSVSRPPMCNQFVDAWTGNLMYGIYRLHKNCYCMM